MTLEHCVALSLIPDLPRPGLTARLRADDPELLETASRHLDRARRERERAAAQGVWPLAWTDPRYPPWLRAIDDAPPLLWYRGRLECLEAPVVAVVGSRAASSVALDMAARLGEDLARRGVTVVSGLARGVDSAAHRGALRSGRTVAVLGSGLGRVYPHEHVPLADAIAVDGLVLSEYPLDTAPLPFHFPQRNRLISGLSRVIVVIEASEKSGSLITATCALDQGREVMAVPGSVVGGRNRGGHALIRDGAKIVETADDIVEGLGLLPPLNDEEPSPASRCTIKSSRDALLESLDVGRAYDLDELASITGLDAPRLLPRLSQWELQGAVRRLEGGRFVRAS